MRRFPDSDDRQLPIPSPCRVPVGLAALVLAVTVIFRFAPRRRQPDLI